MPRPDPELAALSQWFAEIRALYIAASGSHLPGEASILFVQAAAIAAAEYGPDSPELADVLFLAGRCAYGQKNYALAECRFRSALVVSELAHGKDRWEYRNTLIWLAGTLEQHDRITDAECYFEAALLPPKGLAEWEPEDWLLFQYGRFLERQRRYEEALAVAERLRPIAEREVKGDCSYYDYLALRARVLHALGRMQDWQAEVDRIKTLKAVDGYHFGDDPSWLTSSSPASEVA